MHNHKNKWLHNALLVGFYLLLAPPVLAAVKDSIHGAFTGVMAWDLFYNVLGGAGGGVIQVVRNLQNPRKYSNRIAVEHGCVGICRAAHLFAGGQQRRGECQRFVYAVSELLRRRARLRSHQALYR